MPIETIAILIKLPSCLNNMLTHIEVLGLNFQRAIMFFNKIQAVVTERLCKCNFVISAKAF